MRMVSRFVNLGCVLLLFMSSACQSSNLYDPDADLGTNAVNGQAQRTTGFPNYLRPLDVAAKKAEAVNPEVNSGEGVAAKALVPDVARKVDASAFVVKQR
jgi:hypothetical protein